MARAPKEKRKQVDPEWNNALRVLDMLGADVVAIVDSVKKEDGHVIIALAKSLEGLKEIYPHFWDEKEAARHDEQSGYAPSD